MHIKRRATMTERSRHWRPRSTSFRRSRGYGRQLGDVLKAKGDYDGAIKAYETFIKQNRLNSNAKRIDEVLHSGIICDACNSPQLRGYRHKCIQCSDYDLCQACMEKSSHPHPEHDFLKIPSKEWLSENLCQ